MKVVPEDFTQVTQVCVTYTDPSDATSSVRASDQQHYSALRTWGPESSSELTSKWILSTTSSLKLKWDLAVILMSLYSALLVPLELAFNVDQDDAVKGLDYCINVLFAVDIVINFRCSYLNDLKDEVKDSRLIALRYVKSTFVVDLVACIPLDLLLSLTTSTDSTTLRIFSMVKLIRLVRLHHIIYFLRTNKEFKLSLQLFLILCSVLLFIHIVACLWLSIVSINEQWQPLNSVQTHSYLYSDIDDVEAYITSFYYAMLLKGGYDTVPSNTMEMAFAACIVFCGGVFTAIILGYMTITLDGINKNSSSFIDTMESMQEIMMDLKLPALVQSHVTAYMHYTKNFRDMQSGLSTFLEMLPSPLRLQVIRCLVSSTIKEHPLFGLKERAVMFLEQKVTIQSYDPEAVIFSIGSEATHFYVICTGEVLITTRIVPGISSSRRVLKRGMAFGELGLLMNCRRTSTATTKNFSTIGSITKSEFHEMLEEERSLRAELGVVVTLYQDEWRKFVIKSLRYLPYLRNCSDEDLMELSFQVVETQYEAAQVVIERGQSTDAVYIVASGVLSGWLKARGQSVCVLKLQQGDIAGVYSVLDGSPIALSLSAETPSLVLQLTRDQLQSTFHLEFSMKNAPTRKTIVSLKLQLAEIFEKTGDFQVRALASL